MLIAIFPHGASRSLARRCRAQNRPLHPARPAIIQTLSSRHAISPRHSALLPQIPHRLPAQRRGARQHQRHSFPAQRNTPIPSPGQDDWKPIAFGLNKTPTAMGFFGEPLAGNASTLAVSAFQRRQGNGLPGSPNSSGNSGSTFGGSSGLELICQVPTAGQSPSAGRIRKSQPTAQQRHFRRTSENGTGGCQRYARIKRQASWRGAEAAHHAGTGTGSTSR